MINTPMPDKLKTKHLLFLDSLRESGITNMYGAGAYLENAFQSLDRDSASEILSYWMKTFSERHKLEE